ncbi:hypothetical protein [Proteiniphilum sp.]|uniref:hypothetical protein n=1 Tax=Proteiniphilum sp. TaxID=1926877 RepID=UPI003333C640
MWKKFVFVICLLCMIPALLAQEYRWRVGVDYFFDNREYKHSSLTDPQTIHGVWFNTLGGVSWDSTHTIYAGVDLLRKTGTKKTIDKTDIIIYYQYRKPKTLFQVGTFPRNEVLPNYSDFFFEDSVTYFKPLIQGVFFQLGNDRNFFNAWMDWTGYATSTNRESFFLGFSGKASKKILFADFQSYLYHYAGTLPANPDYGVSEQMQIMASAGLERKEPDSFKWLLSAGVFAGVERDRKAEETYKPVGFVARADAEFYGIGTETRFYTGDARMRLFPRYGGDLYWGTPFLRGSSYLQSKWYIRLLESNRVSARVNCNIHVSEGKVLLQQTLSVTANISNFFNPKKKESHIWTNIFR